MAGIKSLIMKKTVLTVATAIALMATVSMEANLNPMESTENASVQAFARLEVGEGIEKKVEDFAAEVAAQAKGV